MRFRAGSLGRGLSIGKRINGFVITGVTSRISDNRTLWVVKCVRCKKEEKLRTNEFTRCRVCECRPVGKSKDALKRQPGDAGLHQLFKTYQYGAKSRGLEFNLSKEFFAEITKKNCAYCGVPPKQRIAPGKTSKRDDVSTHQTYTYNGIDRVDNSRGYVEDNCAPCCKFCNYTKKTHTKEEFMDWILRVVEFNAGTTKGTEL